MDFSNPSAYPLVPHAKYSPTSDTFPSPDVLETYFTDSYTTIPDYAFGNYFDNSASYFNRAAQSLEPAPHWSPPAQNSFISTPSVVSPGTGATTTNLNTWSDLNPASLSCTGDSYEGFTATNYSSRFASHPSPLLTSSGRGSPESPSLSPTSLKPDPFSSTANHQRSSEEPTTKPPPRKRGRPRLYRPASEGSATAKKVPRAQCMPHTEVERKYREKLNMELERLRRAVPILPQSDAADVVGATKPSKSMVLAVAIDYIKELERQRDAAVEEVERLGGKVQFGKVAPCPREAGST